ncbi:MAG TPA: hypothetical protein VFA41_11380 [Ktedonobacteraceae bacterium]|jgi:hypothetical protein|nr:hypothetical protein [Ktedonobacteraceae bacterium]
MTEPQMYDSALKSLLGDEVAEVLPRLLPGSQYVSEQNIEIDRSTLKADLVYNIKYKGIPHVLNMELQTGSDEEMPIRMLKYHVGLFDKHRKPVISMIMYPFETKIPEPPFQEWSVDEVLLELKYKVLPLWKLDAQEFIRDHVVPMYALLPAMKGANAQLLLQAIEEMKQHYTMPKLGNHLVRFRTILRRSKSLSNKDKQIVEEHMQYYDSLLDSDPYIQQKVALERTLERNQARQEMLDLLRSSIMEIVGRRFPSLTEKAQQRMAQLQEVTDLKDLMIQISTAPNLTAARRILKETPTH